MNVAEILTSLKSKGLRTSKTRQAMLDIFSSAHGPIDANVLLGKLPVNKTTIYREITTLIQEGILSEIDFGDGKKRYELASLSHHHHLICTKCKKVEEYSVETDLSAEESRIQKQHAFIVQKHALEFFGVCKRCQ